jgi:Rap1a immunity proteins
VKKGPHLVRVIVVLFAAALFPAAGLAGWQDATARQLLASWKDEDAGMRAVAEVIAAAFASGLAWNDTFGSIRVYCPPAGLAGPQIMSALQQFVGDNPDAADQPYGGVLVKSLHYAFPCPPK